jgi:hypothetical protein
MWLSSHNFKLTVHDHPTIRQHTTGATEGASLKQDTAHVAMSRTPFRVWDVSRSDLDLEGVDTDGRLSRLSWDDQRKCLGSTSSRDTTASRRACSNQRHNT